MRTKDVIFALLIPWGLWMALHAALFDTGRSDYRMFSVIMGVLLAILGLTMIGQ